MFFKRIFLLAATAISVSSLAHGQSADFCKAVTTIIKDAPHGFRNIKGRADQSGHIWACGIKVPGTIASRFVENMGLYYEGGFFQTKNKDEVKGAYDKYRAMLKDCLSAHGYSLSQVDNFYPGLSAYKKLIFMANEESEPNAKPPAHITMEVIYSKELGNYAIVMYIFEH